MEAKYLIAELAEKAGIAENTARRYARLFEDFLESRQYGRVRKYTPESALTLTYIYDLYRKGLSTEEVLEHLHARFAENLVRETQGSTAVSDIRAEQLAAELEGAMERLEGYQSRDTEISLIKQTLSILWSERGGAPTAAGIGQETRQAREATADALRNLEGEVDRLRGERDDLLKRIRALEGRIGEFEKNLGAMEGRLLEEMNEMAATGRPSQSFLSLPLVFRSEDGEYLGVSIKGKHFALHDFVDMIDRSATVSKGLRMHWVKLTTSRWRLEITESSPLTRREKNHFIVVAKRTTPRGNTVAMLERLNFNGQAMPAFFIYELFKQIGRDFS